MCRAYVRRESVPQELDVLLLLRGLEGQRQVVGEFRGFIQSGTYAKSSPMLIWSA